jgi:hypothetical protein
MKPLVFLVLATITVTNAPSSFAQQVQQVDQSAKAKRCSELQPLDTINWDKNTPRDIDDKLRCLSDENNKLKIPCQDLTGHWLLVRQDPPQAASDFTLDLTQAPGTCRVTGDDGHPDHIVRFVIYGQQGAGYLERNTNGCIDVFGYELKDISLTAFTAVGVSAAAAENASEKDKHRSCPYTGLWEDNHGRRTQYFIKR